MVTTPDRVVNLKPDGKSVVRQHIRRFEFKSRLVMAAYVRVGHEGVKFTFLTQSGDENREIPYAGVDKEAKIEIKDTQDKCVATILITAAP